MDGGRRKPDKEGREAILRVHARGKPLAPDVDLSKIARATPGFSGADLANALNEAALLASRRRSAKIYQTDLEEAAEKVVAVLLEQETIDGATFLEMIGKG
jgi:cell division protease FtsH